MTAAIAELVGRAFLAQLSPPETWILIHHHHPAATVGDVLAGVRLWGKQIERYRGRANDG